MPTEVIMPKVDMDMATGTLAVWHVAEGEAVKKGAALFDIETDKAAMEVEAPASGILRQILAQPGQVVAVGSPVAYLYAEGEAVVALPSAAPAVVAVAAAVPAATVAPAATPAQTVAQVANDAADLRATPVARRLAREAGLALSNLLGSGPRHDHRGPAAIQEVRRVRDLRRDVETRAGSDEHVVLVVLLRQARPQAARLVHDPQVQAQPALPVDRGGRVRFPATDRWATTPVLIVDGPHQHLVDRFGDTLEVPRPATDPLQSGTDRAATLVVDVDRDPHGRHPRPAAAP